MRKLRLPSPALVVACLALLITLSGVGYAAKALPRNSVGTTQLKANAVNGSKVANNSLKGADIDEASLSGLAFVKAFMGAGELMPDLPTGTGSTVWATQTVALTKPARLFVLARMSPTIQCDTIPCEVTYYVTVDDTPLPNTQVRVQGSPFAITDKGETTTMGLTGVLPAGSHTLKLVHAAGGGPVTATGAGNRVLSAIAVG